MAWLFLILLGFLLLTWRAWPLPRSASRLRAVFALAAGLAIATYSTSHILPLIHDSCVDAASRLLDSREIGNAIRKGLWEQAIIVWRSAPWLGAGAGQYLAATYRLDDWAEHRPLDTYAHNDALQTLAEFGLIGAGALAVLFVGLLIALWRRRSSLTSADALFVAWAGVLAAHSMLEFPLRYTHFLQLFGLVIGLLISSHWIGMRRTVNIRPVVAAGALALLAGCVLLATDFPRLDRLYWIVQIKLDSNISSTPEVMERVQDAASEVRYFDAYVAHSTSLAVPLTREDLAQKVRDAEALIARSPQAITVSRRVVLAGLEEDGETARRHLRKLFVFYPTLAPHLVDQMRVMAAERPSELGTLLQIFDEEVARAPKARW
jgi:hypothetical protein